jgi:hypothetical protein
LTIPHTVGPAHNFPVRVGTPSALSRAAMPSKESHFPPRGSRRRRRINASVSFSPGFAPNGFRPAHRPVARRLRRRAARSFATMTEKRRVAEYVICPRDGKFALVNFVPSDAPSHEGSSQAFKLDVINLRIPYSLARGRDGTGDKNMNATLKHIALGTEHGRPTRRRCQEFFENDANFDLGKWEGV